MEIFSSRVLFARSQFSNSPLQICDKISLANDKYNVLSFFGKVDAVIKTQLLNIFSSSLYGSVVWNLNHD